MMQNEPAITHRLLYRPAPQPESIYKTWIPAEGEKNSDAPVGCIIPKHAVGDVVYVQEPGIATSEKTARYFTRITGVRVDRLQSISEEDAIKEGITKQGNFFLISGLPKFQDYDPDSIATKSYLFCFKMMIDRIYGMGTWDSNPWVWVFDFELCWNK